MKRSADYILTELGGEPYLCPVGQGIVRRRRQLALNRTSLFLWKTLTEYEVFSSLTKNEAVEFLADAMRSKEENLPPAEELKKDILSFLDTLDRFGVLEEENVSPLTPPSFYRIGRVVLKVEGKTHLMADEMETFQLSEPAEPDLTIAFEEPLLINDPQFKIAAVSNAYSLSFPFSSRLDRIQLSTDGKKAFVFPKGPEDSTMRTDLFHALRVLFSYNAQKKEQFLLHSVSLLYKGKAFLFSASSGTGKSTHGALWKKLWPEEVEDINGDLNLLSKNADGSFTVEGIPWNGTSGIYRNGSFPLGGIIFLHRGPQNLVTQKKRPDEALSLVQRMISPFWTKEQLEKNIAFANALVQKVPVFYLSCTNSDEAAIVMRQAIDALNEDN